MAVWNWESSLQRLGTVVGTIDDQRMRRSIVSMRNALTGCPFPPAKTCFVGVWPVASPGPNAEHYGPVS